MNGGFKKTVMGVAAAAATGLGAYVFHASGKVEPLIVKTEAIEEKLIINSEVNRDRWMDQRTWNEMFLEKQNKASEKLDIVIDKLNQKP